MARKARKNSVTGKIAGKAAGKAAPGVGQVMMVVEGLPVAAGSAQEWGQSVSSTFRETSGHLRQGKFGKATKSAVKGTIHSNIVTMRGAARTAVAAVTAREIADATIPTRTNPAVPSMDGVKQYLNKNVLEVTYIEDLGLYRRNGALTGLYDRVGLSHHNAGLLVRVVRFDSYAGRLLYMFWVHPKMANLQGRKIRELQLGEYFDKVPPAEELVLLTRENPLRARKNSPKLPRPPTEAEVRNHVRKHMPGVKVVEDVGLFVYDGDSFRTDSVFEPKDAYWRTQDRRMKSRPLPGHPLRAVRLDTTALNGGPRRLYAFWRSGAGVHAFHPAQGEPPSAWIPVRPAEQLANMWENPHRVKKNPGPVSTYQDLLATLRALQWMAWSKHWTAGGPSFYGDHLLLQRLYAGEEGGPDINAQIDALGEKMVAYFGVGAVAPTSIEARVNQLIGEVEQQGAGPFEALLALEEHVQKLTRAAYRANQAAGEQFSLGFDDLLMSLANERETAVYLLKRRLGA
jgi:DNA-binding ferritin-like protein